jgi:membrane protease YdiL (CAAX protease family)
MVEGIKTLRFFEDRSARGAAALLSLTFLCIGTLTSSRGWLAASILFQTAVMITSYIGKSPVLSLALLGLAWVCAKLLLPSLAFWPFILLIPLAIALLGKRAFASDPPWALKAGSVRAHFPIAVAVVICAVTGLIAWLELFTPGLGSQKSLVPQVSHPVAIGLILAFGLLNAAMEEIIYRGVILGALETIFKHFPLINCLQAFAFGIAHFEGGVPYGISGLCLSFIYGILQGVLRKRSGGLLLGFLAHVVVDIFVGFLLFFS